MHDPVEVPPMPPGYLFVIANGNGWRSYGWVHRTSGSLSFRNGCPTPEAASLSAYHHALGEAQRKGVP